MVWTAAICAMANMSDSFCTFWVSASAWAWVIMPRASPAVSTPRSTSLLIKLITTLPVGVVAIFWPASGGSTGASAAEAALFPAVVAVAAKGAVSSLA